MFASRTSDDCKPLQLTTRQGQPNDHIAAPIRQFQHQSRRSRMIRVLCICGVWAVAARAAVIAGVRKI